MKKITTLALAFLALSAASAQADIAPPAGTLVSAEITGNAAMILDHFLLGNGAQEQAFPPEIGPIKADETEVNDSGAEKRVFTKGTVAKSSDRVSTSMIGASRSRGAPLVSLLNTPGCCAYATPLNATDAASSAPTMTTVTRDIAAS